MEKTQICLWATPEEIKLIEQIKLYHRRTTNSDTLRFLIQQEAEKILPQIISNEINVQETAAV